MTNAKTQTPFSVRKSRKRSPPSPRLATRAAVRTFATGRWDLARHLKPSHRVKKALRSRHRTRSTRAHRAIPRFYWPRRTSSSERREREKKIGPNFTISTLLKLCNSEVGPGCLWCASLHRENLSLGKVSRHVGFCCSFYTTCLPCCHSLSLSAITLSGTEGPTVIGPSPCQNPPTIFTPYKDFKLSLSRSRSRKCL